MTAWGPRAANSLPPTVPPPAVNADAVSQFITCNPTALVSPSYIWTLCFDELLNATAVPPVPLAVPIPKFPLPDSILKLVCFIWMEPVMLCSLATLLPIFAVPSTASWWSIPAVEKSPTPTFPVW